MDSLSFSTLQAGRAWPLGAHFDGEGVNFAVFSAHAHALEVCLFDAEGTQELTRLYLPGHTGNIWHGYLPGAQPGLVYGLRAYGPWRPDSGHRFDASKVLLDPYAREIVGSFQWSAAHFTRDHPQQAYPSVHDNAELALKSRVTAEDFDWGDDRHPYTPLDQSILYECHVKGFSQLRPDIPPELRGSFAALAHPNAIKYFKDLGVTALNLLPVHYHLDEERLVRMGLSNYWGYNTLGFFCLDPRYASGAQGLSARDEFRRMVRTLHAAGLEVILDVVYNHTAEAGHDGPTLSFRGLDNASYYDLVPNDANHYKNYSGCGNTVNIRQLNVLQLVMDSLRYWVSDMHVDGFRFDLAPVLGRGERGFSPSAAFFAAVAQDPVLSRVKMIAEPWDTGPGGYQVGNFPNGWLEWNDQFRDGMRRFWVQNAASPDVPVEKATRGDFAMRLCGSSDIFQARKRSPAESLNYVVSHDGFTLRDLVSYNQRHNLANGENNCDGHGHNLSFNFGVEGPTDSVLVNQLRHKMQRALLATTLLAQGTPMLCAGDEVGHSQNGNNNPYCQDNAMTWIDWSSQDGDLLEFTRYVIGLRQRLLPFANQWYSGTANVGHLHNLSWLNADGSVLQHESWHQPLLRTLGCLIDVPGRSEQPLLLLFNASASEAVFNLPAGQWKILLDTEQARGLRSDVVAQSLNVGAYSLQLLQQG